MQNCNLTILKETIEETRTKINNSADNKEYLDQEVISLSQELDRLLNKYYNIKYERCN